MGADSSEQSPVSYSDLFNNRVLLINSFCLAVDFPSFMVVFFGLLLVELNGLWGLIFFAGLICLIGNTDCIAADISLQELFAERRCFSAASKPSTLVHWEICKTVSLALALSQCLYLWIDPSAKSL